MERIPKTYAEAGVDIDKEEKAIKSLISVIDKSGKSNIGFFANVVDFDNVKLAFTCDGVGTKILVAEAVGKYDTVGIDLVAMNVNDLLCIGAKPLYLLDYIAVKNPEPKLLEEIGKGLAKGAKQAGVKIIGGETATIPEMLNASFDLAGFCVGIVDRIIDCSKIKEKDVILGLPSSGIHSNGLTLARRVLLAKYDLYDELNGKELWKYLLEPTKIYVRDILEIIRSFDVKGVAHITGGGFLNIKRLNKSFDYVIENLPEPQIIFKEIQKIGKISDEEMFKTFNMGVGMILIVAREDAEEIISKFDAAGIGYVRKGNGKVILKENKIIL